MTSSRITLEPKEKPVNLADDRPPDIHTPTRTPWYSDWRVWLGVAITLTCVWYSIRDVPLAALWGAMLQVDLVLLLTLSVPAYVANVYVRALRWRHLTNPIASIERGALFRAQAIGFMVNNLLPLRIGELVRCWFLSRETGTSGVSILATVVLERVLDILSVVTIALAALVWAGRTSPEAGLLAEGALMLLPVALVPLLGVIALRLMPRHVIAISCWCARPFPERLQVLVEKALHRFAEGLGALSGGRHLLWLMFHSATIWLGLSTLPLLAGVLAFDLHLGSPQTTLLTCWILLGAVGVAVAIPSVPGFFGPYQLAFKVVLVRFGVDPATALALGLLAWFVSWVSLTLLGLLVVRAGPTSLIELTSELIKYPTSVRAGRGPN